MPVISRWIDIGGYLSKVTQSISSRFFPTPSGTEKRDIFEFVKSSNFPFSKNRFDIRRTSIDRIIMILGIWYLEPIVNNDCTRIRKVFLNFLQRDLRHSNTCSSGRGWIITKRCKVWIGVRGFETRPFDVWRNAHARDAHASRVPRLLESVENYPCPRQ